MFGRRYIKLAPGNLAPKWLEYNGVRYYPGPTHGDGPYAPPHAVSRSRHALVPTLGVRTAYEKRLVQGLGSYWTGFRDGMNVARAQHARERPVPPELLGQ